jgi:serine/threonine protein kinase
VTRWYRAPELLADCQNYGKTVDVWALGCIFAEMLTRKPFFQGRDPTHQLYTIVNVLGSPSEEDIAFISHESAKKVIREMGNRPKMPLRKHFPECTPSALDLLERMLVFNPEKRITVDEALNHPYLAQLHNQCDEPISSEAFNFDFEREALDRGEDIPKEELQALIYREMLHFRPATQEMETN